MNLFLFFGLILEAIDSELLRRNEQHAANKRAEILARLSPDFESDNNENDQYIYNKKKLKKFPID